MGKNTKGGKKPPKAPKPAKTTPSTAVIVYEKQGRPPLYTREIANRILIRLAEGKSLRRICAEDDTLPKESTVRGWAVDDVDGFSARYARARDIGLDCMADEMLDIADDGSNDWMERETRSGNTIIVLNDEAVRRSALRIDTRKFLLAKITANRSIGVPSSAGPNPGPDYVLKPDETGPSDPIL